MLGRAATSIPLPGDAVLKELRRVLIHMEISPDQVRAPHAEHRIVTWDTLGYSHGTPRTVSDDRPLKRPAPLWDRMTQAAGRTARLLSLSVRLDPLRCQLTPRTAALPVGPHRAAAGSLACACRAECPATEHGNRQFPVPRLAAASRSPTRVPAATDSLSAMEALRLGLLAVHDGVTEAICTVPLSLADRVRTVDSTFSPRHCGAPRNVTADADAVMARSLPQDCVNAWHVGLFTAVRRPY
ncbi:hypothetical protein TcBrA4_0110950 [Trypanosoma cruzi]|nr:hypothetical protein TcBrA4_0110950 [Trypanosoma cruzi]